MNSRRKEWMTLALAAALSLAFVCSASAEPDRQERRTLRIAEPCIAGIGERVEYDGAARVIHWIVGVEQKNLEETALDIETAVYREDETTPVYRYRASCLVSAYRGVVELHVVDVPDRREARS